MKTTLFSSKFVVRKKVSSRLPVRHLGVDGKGDGENRRLIRDFLNVGFPG